MPEDTKEQIKPFLIYEKEYNFAGFFLTNNKWCFNLRDKEPATHGTTQEWVQNQ